MAFTLLPIDQEAIKRVKIVVDIDAKIYQNKIGDNLSKDWSANQLELNEETLMFPPEITKDSKTANWLSTTTGAYETFKYYIDSEPRILGLKFEWIANGEKFRPNKIHEIISKIKAYFYGAYFGGNMEHYPVIKIYRLYDVINTSGAGATFRMMSVDIKQSREMVRDDVTDLIYPIHTVLDMSLESCTQLQNLDEAKKSEEGLASNFYNLAKSPALGWF